MKASIFLAATGAALAMAGPINKRAMETDWVYEVVTVTVTAGNEPGGVFVEQPRTKKPAPSTSITAPPPPPPEPTIVVPKPEPEPTQPPPPPPVVAPKPSTKTRRPKPTKKPEPEPSPEPEPEPQPEPEPEPEQPEEPEQPGLGEYAKLMLHHHNIHRSNHSVPDLSWDSTLAGYAKTIADSCVFEHDMDQGSGGYGQNLASWGADDKAKVAASMMDKAAAGVTVQWYNGEFSAWSYYGMDDPPEGADLMAWGHFTQVLWKSTEKVGCHTTQCGPEKPVLPGFHSLFTVCNYDPPGNYGGEYGDNVLEPKGEQTVTV